MREKKVKILFEEFCWNAEKTAGFKLIVRQREAQPPQLGLLAMHTLTGDSGKVQWKNLDAGCFRSMIALRLKIEAALKKGEEITLAPAKEAAKEKITPKAKKEGDAKKAKNKAKKGKSKAKKAQVVDEHAPPSGKLIRRNAATGESAILQMPA